MSENDRENQPTPNDETPTKSGGIAPGSPVITKLGQHWQNAAARLGCEDEREDALRNRYGGDW